MKIFAVFSERKAGLVRIWARSWSDRGWAPRLISPKEVNVHGSVKAAVHARGGGLLGDIQVINVSYPVRRRPVRRVVWFGRTGWRSARLLRFPVGTLEEDIRGCLE